MSEQVLIQGARYSFHDQAADLFGIPEECRESAETHDILYNKLRMRAHGLAVTAFINTTKGRINGSYERILAGNARVIGRVDLDIVLPLYGIPGTRSGEVRYIHTQSHAYDQCAETLREQYPSARWISEPDTALSAFVVRALGEGEHAAITPHLAGKAAGLECLVPGMQDRKHNVTSFYLLGKGDNAVVPEASTVTVAGLYGSGSEDARRRLRSAVDLGIVSLVHESDAGAQSLIVELRPDDSQQKPIEGVQSRLQGAYDVTYLGGYMPQQ